MRRLRIRPSPAALLTVGLALAATALALLPGGWGPAYGQTAGPSPPPPPTPTATVVAPPPTVIDGVTVELANEESVTTSADETVTVSTFSDQGEVSVSVPAGAIEEGATLRVAAVTNIDEVQQQAPPAEHVSVDLVLIFSITVTDAEGEPITEDFAEPVAVEFTVPAAFFLAGAVASDLVVAFLGSDGAWVYLPTVVTRNADGSFTFSGVVNHLTLLAVLQLTPIVLAVPAGGPFEFGIAGTNDPVRLAAVQQADIESMFTLVGGQWLTFIPGAPAKVNTLTPANLTPDTPVLFRFAGFGVTPAPPPPAVAVPAPPARSVVVGPDETLLEIALRLGVDWRVVAALNGIEGPNYIVVPGQVLALPEGFRTLTV